MTDPGLQADKTPPGDFPPQRSRLFWATTTAAILAILLVCTALIMIAARS